jgi:sulfite exporter TauE/SafE
VYAALAAAVTSGSALGGAATMAAFGVGTLPMLMAMGSAGAAIARMARVRMVRVAAGAAMVALGLLQIVHVSQAWADAGSPTVHACCPNHRT